VRSRSLVRVVGAQAYVVLRCATAYEAAQSGLRTQKAWKEQRDLSPKETTTRSSVIVHCCARVGSWDSIIRSSGDTPKNNYGAVTRQDLSTGLKVDSKSALKGQSKIRRQSYT
jgi:hypothetical protein